jgi:hypothetical protein
MEIRTRSGRIIKKPERYSPIEKVEDDFSESDYDSDESDVSSDVSFDSEDLSDSEDADENGNLKNFIVDSDEEVKSNNDNKVNGCGDDSSFDGSTTETDEPDSGNCDTESTAESSTNP